MLRCLTLSSKVYADGFLTGGDRMVGELVKALIAGECDTVLLAPSLPPGVASQDVEFLRVKPSRFSSNLMPAFLMQTAQTLKVVCRHWWFLRRKRLDTIIVVGFTNGLVALLLKLLFRCPLSILLPEDPQEYRALSVGKSGLRLTRTRTTTSKRAIELYLKIVALFERLLLLRTDLIIVQSETYRQILSQRYPTKNKSFYVLPSPVETSWVETEWRECNCSTQAERLGFIGFLERRKGVRYLIQAVERIIDHNDKVTLEIAGIGPLSDELRAIVDADPRLRRKITFHGWVRRPLEFVSRCDLIVIPSLSDSLPRVIGEALYVGTPIIGSRVGGIPEQLKYEELLFEPASAEAIVAKLHPIIEETAKYLEIRELCSLRRQALTFDWGARLQALLDNV